MARFGCSNSHALHASCFTGDGYRPKTGRLSRVLEDGSLEPLLTDLNYPASLLPLPDGSLYVSEVFPGRILHITFGDLFGGEKSDSRAVDASRSTPAP
jgi:glucose/arabinose dehydrogenase